MPMSVRFVAEGASRRAHLLGEILAVEFWESSRCSTAAINGERDGGKDVSAQFGPVASILTR